MDFFKDMLVSVLLSGSTWTLTKQQEALLDGTFTRMLRVAFDISLKKQSTKKRLYVHLAPTSERRLWLAGHLWVTPPYGTHYPAKDQLEISFHLHWPTGRWLWMLSVGPAESDVWRRWSDRTERVTNLRRIDDDDDDEYLIYDRKY